MLSIFVDINNNTSVALINQTPQTQDEPEASGSCSWWSWSRVWLGLKHGLVVLVATNLAYSSIVVVSPTPDVYIN